MKQWKIPLKQERLRVPFLLLILLSLMLSIIGSTAEASSGMIGSIQGMEAEKRAQIYRQIKWETTGWQIGKTLSIDPYSIVAGYDNAAAEPIYRVRVWTGLLLRDEANLLTYWDELSIHADGILAASTLDLDVMLKGYFSAASQSEYASKKYIGAFPWSIELPTDAEADRNGKERLESGTMINGYELPLEGEQARTKLRLNKMKDVPELIAQVDIPRDIQRHWAEVLTIKLMQNGIIQGFEDQTIRPEEPLTRAQFISMLSRVVGIESNTNTASHFSDIQGHWAEQSIIAAEQAGLLGQTELASGAFRPDESVTRVDMAEWVDRAISIRGSQLRQAQVAFPDISALTAEKQAAVSRLAGLRILSGYEDGSFQPDRGLKRAEAFAVLYRFMDIVSAEEEEGTR
jgi:hypothetical protein